MRPSPAVAPPAPFPHVKPAPSPQPPANHPHLHCKLPSPTRGGAGGVRRGDACVAPTHRRPYPQSWKYCFTRSGCHRRAVTRSAHCHCLESPLRRLQADAPGQIPSRARSTTMTRPLAAGVPLLSSSCVWGASPYMYDSEPPKADGSRTASEESPRPVLGRNGVACNSLLTR